MAPRSISGTPKRAQSEQTGANVVFLQDMEQALLGWVARSAMRDEWNPGDEPLLLLDDRGEVRQAFGVSEGATVVVTLRNREILDLIEAQSVLDDPDTVRRSFGR